MTELVATGQTTYSKALDIVANLAKTRTKAGSSVAKAKVSVEPLVLNAKAQNAVENFADLAKEVEFPTYPRELTPEEVQAYLPLFQGVQGLEAAAKSARQRIKDAVYSHMDIAVDDDGGFKGESAKPEKDSNGFYITDATLGAEDSDYEFSRETRHYAPDLPVEAIHRLYQEGKITRGDYYRATKKRPVPRDIDEEGFADLLAAKPELAEVFAAELVTKAPTTSLNLRKKPE